ncbi:MAG: outer membrane lipoprotein-sorting protein [Candidatus Marinimicrobia bacterium]|nr:outer membrane lipoprotein-sorting protein [Candidatus Neomarinimicrobiota bacterium]MCF7828519.1 outer membrane lipoprotein-sorting protein [Candidatus Neomarinimicrobiota bacterium]MCF7882058.1 outer membrane lipoprotein-sorting protein [Candidatus Neomarinimicrobiota bacterium]
MQRVLLGIVVTLVMVATVTAQQPDAREIVRKIDRLYRSESSYAEMEMHIVTPHWERTLRMKTWTQGTEKTFIRITAPKKEAGTATLRIGNEMWNFLPNTNKVMKIPPSMMMGSWMGSDFTNDDLVKEFSLLEDYTFELIDPEDAEDGYLYIQAEPKDGTPIIWGKQIIKIRAEDYIPVREEYYDEGGTLMRVMNFKDITTFDGRQIPAVMELIPQEEEGKRTELRYLDAEFNTDIDDNIFTLRNLRSY